MKVLSWIKKEFLHVFPAFIFFYISFNLINITEGFMFKKAGIGSFSFMTIFVAAAVVAKVLIVIDHLPFISLFPNKPLIYSVVWKTLLYGAATFCIRAAIRLFPFIWGQESIDIDWKLFMAVQAWYVILFFVFVTFREFAMAIGPVKVRRIFFGK
jgi:hypothetical protein